MLLIMQWNQADGKMKITQNTKKKSPCYLEFTLAAEGLFTHEVIETHLFTCESHSYLRLKKMEFVRKHRNMETCNLSLLNNKDLAVCQTVN